jgi:hypothetical protein
VGNRLEDLNTDLVRMVETGNEEIAAAQRALNDTIAKWGSAIEQQRGRIAERELIESENAPQSHAEGANSNGKHDALEQLRDAVNNGA